MAFDFSGLPKSIDIGKNISDVASKYGINKPANPLPTSPLPYANNVPTISGFVDELVNGWIIRPNKSNIDSTATSDLIFSIITEHSVQNDAEITDHICEDLSVIQQHIVHKPIILTVKGVIAEKVYKASASVKLLSTANEKLLAINSYLPNNATAGANELMLETATKALEAIDYIDGLVQTGVGLYNVLAQNNPDPAETAQQKAYNKLRALKLKAMPSSIITPFGIFENMLIQNVSLTQHDTNYQSEISVTFKQIKEAKSKTTKYNSSKFQGANRNNGQTQNDKTTINGKIDKNSTLYYWTSSNKKPILTNKMQKITENTVNYTKITPQNRADFLNKLGK